MINFIMGIVIQMLVWMPYYLLSIEKKELDNNFKKNVLLISLLIPFAINYNNFILPTCELILVTWFIKIHDYFECRKDKRLIKETKEKTRRLTINDFTVTEQEDYNHSNFYLAVSSFLRNKSKYELYITLVVKEDKSIVYMPVIKNLETGKYTFANGKTKLINYSQVEIYLYKNITYHFYEYTFIEYSKAKKILEEQVK